MTISIAAPSPYCGAPPTMATLADRWNGDPWLIAGLIVGVGIYAVLWRRRPGARPACFAAGWGLTALALVSPLCALSVSLFAARVGQHMILTLVAAPLVALGLPAPGRRLPGQEAWSALGFTLMLWAWHSPALYDATFRDAGVYWTMHLTTWGAALAFWWTVLRAPAAASGAAMIATVATGFQMALLGAIITWAPAPLYRAHLVTPYPWGLTPLQDQELGGTLMWVPGGLIFLAAIVVPLALLLRRSGPTLTFREA